VGSSGIPEWSLSAPSNLTATAISPSQIDLQWQGSLGADGYEIERSVTTNTGYSLVATVGLNVTAYSDMGLSQSTTYWYRVRAMNTIGDRSAYSNVASAFVTYDFSLLPTSWLAIAAGDYHTIVLGSDGTLWAWGNNQYWQLGLGDTTGTNRIFPTQIEVDFDYVIFTDVAVIETGTTHSLALKTDGSLWGWGTNGAGQLGTGDTISAEAPYQGVTDTNWFVLSGTNLTTFAAGYAHTLATKTTGTLWAWGVNNYGQLGLGNSGYGTDRTTPSQVGTASDWASIAAGYLHTLATKTSGTLWAWGQNASGKLGLGDYTNRATPSQVGTDSDWVVVAASGDTYGSGHTIALKTSGTLWAWGYNAYGQLGLGNSGYGTDRTTPSQVGTASDWASIAAGYLHTLVTKTTGTLWAWGYNWSGQLGDGTTDNRKTPRQIGTDSDWSQVAAGYYHTLGLKTSGNLWAWGRNDFGQLGLGDTIGRNIPTLVGE